MLPDISSNTIEFTIFAMLLCLVALMLTGIVALVVMVVEEIRSRKFDRQLQKKEFENRWQQSSERLVEAHHDFLLGVQRNESSS